MKSQNIDLHEQILHGLVKTVYSQSNDQRAIDISMIVRRIYESSYRALRVGDSIVLPRYLLKVLN